MLFNLPRNARFPVWVLFSAVLVGFNVANRLTYMVRFDSPNLNNLFLAVVALSIPVAVTMLGKVTKQRYLRFTVFVAAALLLISALLFTLICVIFLASRDTLQDELVVDRAVYRVYMQEPPMATSLPSTVVRKEIDTPFGVKLIRPLWESERFGIAHIRQLDATTLEVSIDGDGFRTTIRI